MARINLLVILAVAALAREVSAFLPARLPATPSPRRALTSRAPVESRRRASSLSMAAEYWDGEWVCADCGYVYDISDFDGKRFEDQKAGFKCPQCSGPRRRFAKRVGNRLGTTRDGGDGPIVLFSVVGGLAVIGFGLYAALSGL